MTSAGAPAVRVPCRPRELLCTADNACLMAGTLGTLRWSPGDIH